MTETKATEPASEDLAAVDASFAVGTDDGKVYENSFFHIRLDADGAGLLLANEDQRLQLSSVIADTVNNDTVKEALESGSTYMDLYAYAPDMSRNLNMNIQSVGPVIGILGTADAVIKSTIDNIAPQMKEALENAGLQNIEVEKSTCLFLGKEVLCSVITGEKDGLSLYEKQVFLIEGSYMAVLTAAGVSEEEAQALLDAVEAME